MDKSGQLTGPWVAELGYDQVDGAFVRGGATAIDVHPFAPELRAIFTPDRGPTGTAVFCIDRVPTVCLIDQQQLDDEPSARLEQMRSFCERLWNQNLARVVLITGEQCLEAWSVDNPDVPPQRYTISERAEAARDWSVSGLLGGEALKGRDTWFDPHKRVDKVLLDNILVLVEQLTGCGIEAAPARRLVARLIFVTYLEDRGIVGDAYRSLRGVRSLFDLIRDRDRKGLRQLIHQLRDDFNGDFLNSADREAGWENLSDESFHWIGNFLGQTVLRTGQTSFWRYDFGQIPIELIASIYETFLASKDADHSAVGGNKAKRKQGAYYTPRLLADWVVDLAIADRDILSEKIFDGACGSGMLLTAAYRRLIRAGEARNARNGKPPEVDFASRCLLLTDHIFGGDIDEDACQLTAFSLYLALLSDLSPRDLAELRKGGHKLPTLTDNIRRGSAGDFFAIESEELNRARYGIFLSNPPWRELRVNEPTCKAVEAWHMRQEGPKPHIPKRQIAAAFALAAADTLQPGGRVALILPVTPMVSVDPTQLDFRAHLLGRYHIEKIINFSDMRRLIFADAVHPFVVLIATARDTAQRFPSIERERFEYWTPKTDIALAFGRLAVHGGDRADLPASALIDESPQLAIRYWGAEADVALLDRLKHRGTIGDLTQSGWLEGKGFHATDEDQRRPKESWYRDAPDWMLKAPFLDAKRLPRDLPMVTTRQLAPFPFERIARERDERLFRGPRVLWTDGAHPTDGVKAIYAEQTFSCQHSLAILSAPETANGRLLARFLTVYLRSPMGLWLLLLLSGSVASERPKLHLAEALDWPFWSLERHPAPEEALAILIEVDRLLASIEAADELLQPHLWADAQPRANRLVYGYFHLAADEVAMIEEMAALVGDGLQPSSLRYDSLMKPLRQAPTEEIMSDYSEALAKTLGDWRDATGGSGDIQVASWTGRSVPLGAAVLTLGGAASGDRFGDDGILDLLAAALLNVTDQPLETLLTIPDIGIIEGNRIFVVKPLVTRFWMRRCATEDGTRLALQLQAIARERTKA